MSSHPIIRNEDSFLSTHGPKLFVRLLIILLCAFSGLQFIYGLLFSCAAWRLYAKFQRYAYALDQKAKIIAFFHPYCDGGGGGERVLWIAIESILKSTDKDTVIAIYNGGTKELGGLLKTVEKQFKIDLRSNTSYSSRLKLININTRFLLEARWYPVATMVLQCFFSAIVGLECLLRIMPDVYFDTTGAAFTYPVFSILSNSRVICYVHYPIISSDMLQKVREQRPSYNNDARIASSVTMSSLKVIYYKAIAFMYYLTACFATRVVVNSSWTEGHIRSVWGIPRSKRGNKLTKIYPPCNTLTLQKINIGQRDDIVLSIGQFRPEKDHLLQLRAFQQFTQQNPTSTTRMVLLGGTRGKEDEQLVRSLQDEARSLGIEEKVEFIVNAPFEVVQRMLAQASVGVHSMWNEHFGISIVEMMAAGMIVIAHNSGGPRMDIVVPSDRDETRVGFLASTAAEYARSIQAATRLTKQQARALRERARTAAAKFSDAEFGRSILQILGIGGGGGGSPS